jgi:5-(carboxyamino)imidazole ribonucleotide mutase
MQSKKNIYIIMGSQTDYSTMQYCEKILDEFDLKFETLIVSAHRTPDRLYNFCKEINANENAKIIIAGAGGSAHLPGMIASMVAIPVIGVPVESKTLKGLDSLLSIVQMPAGIPVATVAIGEAGAKNAGLLAVSIMSLNNPKLSEKLKKHRLNQTNKVSIKPIKISE